MVRASGLHKRLDALSVRTANVRQTLLYAVTNGPLAQWQSNQGKDAFLMIPFDSGRAALKNGCEGKDGSKGLSRTNISRINSAIHYRYDTLESK